MTPARESWFEDEAGPLIRPYAVTAGRRGGLRYDLDLITLIVTVRHEIGLDWMEREHSQIVEMCTRPLSVAEVAAKLHFPLIVTKLLICDLIAEGYLSYRSPILTLSSATPDPYLLQAVLDGIRKL